MMHLNLKENLEYLPKFYQLLDLVPIIENDKMYKNYTRERCNLDNFLYFSIVLENNDIVAFSGIEHKPFWPNVGRVSSRLYVVPEKRRDNRPSEYNSKIMLPEQTQWCIDNGLDLAFWSREDTCERLMTFLTKRTKKYMYKTAKGLYNVCNHDSPSCWQRIAYYPINTDSLDFMDRKDG